MDEKREKHLRRIENYVTYGIPNKKTISELIFKRGYLNINKKRTALQTNELIEEAFGDKGIICLDDAIHEIQSHGENFLAVNKALLYLLEIHFYHKNSPFRLNKPNEKDF